MAFFKKNKEEKRRKGESIIGKIIYGFLLFAPLFNILVTCMYATFNKNAYQSYSQYTVDTMVHIDRYNNNNETLYTAKYVSPSTENSSITPFAFISISASDLSISQAQYDTLTRYYFRSNNEIWFANEDDTYIVKKSLTLPIFESFTFIGNKAQHFFDIFNVTYIVTTNGTLDNAFIYGIQKTEDTNLFNWAKTTGTYTVIQNTCNLLGITNTFTPMLLTYWLIISIIYFIYDIALILILIVHKKIHELTDSL